MGQRLASQKSALASVRSSAVSARVMRGCHSKLSLSVLASLWTRKLRTSPFFTSVVSFVGTVRGADNLFMLDYWGLALKQALLEAYHGRGENISDAEVLAHELWHVVSRHRPALAQRLYALIGYQPVAELE